MKKVFSIMKKIVPAFMVVALVISIFNFSSYDPHNELSSLVPSSASAVSSSVETDNKTPEEEKEKTQVKKTESKSESKIAASCSLKASSTNVVTGSDIVLSWEVTGLTDVFINGEKVEGLKGDKVFENIQKSTSFTLTAKSSNGSNCVSSVEVACLPTIPTPPTCTELGFDLEVARFDWKNGSFQKVSGEKEGFQITVSGDNSLANWKSNKSISKVIASAAENHKVFNGGDNGEINKCNIPNGCSGIASLQFCGNFPEPEPEPEPTPEVVPMCTNFTASAYTLPFGGGEIELKWTTKDASKIVIDNGIGEVKANGSKKVSVKKSTTFTLIASEGDKEHDCYVSIDVEEKEPEPVAPVCDLFSVSPSSIVKGNSAELSWKTSDAKKVTINNGVGEVDLTGKFSVKPLANTKYTLTAFGEKDTKVSCNVELKVTEPPVQKVPMCTTFTATPFTLPAGGGEIELKWTTKDASKIVIDNGIGEVKANGSKKVSVKKSTTFTLIASEGDKEHDCYVSIDVEEKTVTPPVKPEKPSLVCSLNSSAKEVKNGGEVKLTWSTKNAVSATLAGFGKVDLKGEKKIKVTADKTFVLEIKGEDGKTISCKTAVKVKKDPKPPVTKALTCKDNSTLTLSEGKIKKGESATLAWTTKGGVTAVSFDQGIEATDLNGSVKVSPSTKTSYTMTISDGKTSVDCPVTLDVEVEKTTTTPPTTSTTKRSGGSVSMPTCKLNASKTKIKAGEEVKLTWTTSRNNDLILKDGKGEVLVTTADLVGNEKYDVLDNGSKIVKPTSNITYTLISEKGSRETICEVKVEVEKDTIVVSQIRDQQPLIAGISLSEVPYTGFEAGPLLTVMFYILLTAWALYIAYAIVARKKAENGMLATAGIPEGMISKAAQKAPSIPEMIRPDVFVASVKAPEVGNLFKEVQTLPENLPVGLPTADFGEGEMDVENSARVASDNLITQIENYAHSEKVLISSDAIRYFIAHTDAEEEKMTALSLILASAKTQFPAEDGWIVVNEKRMRDLCLVCAVNQPEAEKRSFIPTVIPEGSGSLAEAIVTGNISAAYNLLENNPMFSLADAASDLDSVYRQRFGQEEVVSTMLVEKTKDFSDEKLMNTIKALTSALDGSYTDELSAVKMAILKAVKVVEG